MRNRLQHWATHFRTRVRVTALRAVVWARNGIRATVPQLRTIFRWACAVAPLAPLGQLVLEMMRHQ